MVTTVSREQETTAVAEQIEQVAVSAPASPAVDISAVPESPAELLKQWDAPKRSFTQMIASVWNHIWDVAAGPAKTDKERINRQIFEHSRYYRSQGPLF